MMVFRLWQKHRWFSWSMLTVTPDAQGRLFLSSPTTPIELQLKPRDSHLYKNQHGIFPTAHLVKSSQVVLARFSGGQGLGGKGQDSSQAHSGVNFHDVPFPDLHIKTVDGF